MIASFSRPLLPAAAAATVTLALIWGSTGFAQAAAPAAQAARGTAATTKDAAAPAATPKPAAHGGDFALKSRSTFSAAGDATARNPFLPIGYVRPAGPVRVEVVADVRPEQFTVTSTLLDVPPLAVINGKSYEVGDKIPVDATGREFVTVKQIGDGVVVLDHRGRALRCVSRARR